MYLCCVEILSFFRSNFDFLRIFKVAQNGLGPNFGKND